ncbi:MAG: manganese efflux pump MntP family protein [bacterium]|nr:manganese efflux pump MntP family protein [bacterium]MCM1374353.1 manganese efflux pump MntP family protein [Muribaculum sp.]
MSLLNLFLIAVGLSMDAFAVSVCKGLAMEKAPLKKAALAGVWFGSFQALMPLAGYLLGSRFEQYITDVDHWIAFILLALIGGNMIREAFSANEEETSGTMYFKEMLLLAVATSIDALAVGITFAFLQVNLLSAVGLIGITTFVLSTVGVKVGNLFGSRYKSKAELVGGVLLILMGFNILLEHLLR